MAGSISPLTSTMVVAGGHAAKNSPWARPYSCQREMSVTNIRVRTIPVRSAPSLPSARSSCMASPQVLVHFVRERRDLLPAAELGRQLEAGAAHHVALAQHDERALQRGLGERLEPPHASREPGGPPAIERPLRPLPRGHRPGEQRIERVHRDQDALEVWAQEVAEE